MEDTVLNFKCIRCGRVYSTLRGISSHVRQTHQKKFRHSDFEPTTEEALPLVYGKSRSRAAQAVEAQIDRLTPNYECVHCGKVFGSVLSIAGHIRWGHKKQCEPTDYERTAKEALPSRTKMENESNEMNETKGSVECQNLSTSVL
jgi:uncharacterized C2H2 Zn-finger protein